jgi:hypothetical protein
VAPAPSPTAAPPPPATSAPTLLARYLIRGPQPDYEIVRYQPRQFAPGREVDPGGWTTARVDDPGPYAGWDVLNTPDRQISTVLSLSPWLELELNRPARLAIVWRGGGAPPGWLSDWAPGATVILNGTRYPTFTRSVAAGPLQLGAVYSPGTSGPSRVTYLVLAAEADGRPSAAPVVPGGRTAPQPNQTCPAWVHAQYVTTGPDGQTYPTWHPQIDPVYWCYFRHEHGSDPAPHKPPFGYAAARGRVDENHEGFKVYTFTWEDTVAVVTHHFGTASASRAACVRYHELDLAIYRGGALQGSVFHLADHGRAVHARTLSPLLPSACPNQALQAAGSNGVRQFQIADMQPVAYEPWRTDPRGTIVGIPGFWAPNTTSRITDCNTMTCDADVPTGDQGETRFTQYDSGFGIHAAAAGATGTFYTDPLGRTLRAAGDPDAVRQFVAPGTALSLPVHDGSVAECYQTHPFGGAYACQDRSPLDDNQNVEGALRSPN